MGGVVVAYIILYFTKPSALYGRTTAGDCWVSSRLGGKMTKNKSGEHDARRKEQGERSKGQRARRKGNLALCSKMRIAF